MERCVDCGFWERGGISRGEVLGYPGTRRLVREVLRLTEDRDVVDRYKDILLVLRILKQEMDDALRGEV